MDYAGFLTRLTTLLETQATTTEFVNILPAIIDYAEQRIYREIDLQSVITFEPSVVSTAVGVAVVDLSTVAGLSNAILQEFNIADANGARHQLIAISKEAMAAIWGVGSSLAMPQFFAPLGYMRFRLGPIPDAIYPLDAVVTVRPAPLSASNASTFLTANLPDLFIAASMIFAAGYQRNFGAQSDDPQMSSSWEAQYKALLLSAVTEEARRKFQASAWSSMSVPIAATPQRGNA